MTPIQYRTIHSQTQYKLRNTNYTVKATQYKLHTQIQSCVHNKSLPLSRNTQNKQIVTELANKTSELW